MKTREKRKGGRFVREKGKRAEYAVRDYFRSLGFIAERVPNSGNARSAFNIEKGLKADVVVMIGKKNDRKNILIEVKSSGKEGKNWINKIFNNSNENEKKTEKKTEKEKKKENKGFKGIIWHSEENNFCIVGIEAGLKTGLKTELKEKFLQNAKDFIKLFRFFKNLNPGSGHIEMEEIIKKVKQKLKFLDEVIVLEKKGKFMKMIEECFLKNKALDIVACKIDRKGIFLFFKIA